MSTLLGVALCGCLVSLPLTAQNPRSLTDWPLGRMPPAHTRTVQSDQRQQTVSADSLRRPISDKTRRRLQRALDWMRLDKHQEAIQELEDTLAKDPSSAPYVHSLLGCEYMKTDQFAAAVNSFEQAVSLLPHDAINHANFGVSLAAVGDYKRAEEEARRGEELEPENPGIRRFLRAVVAFNQSAAQLR